MSKAQADPRLTRALSFLRRLGEAESAKHEPWRFGTAYFDLALPDVWDRNFLRVDALPDDVEASELLAEADRVQGAAGLRHRKLVFDDLKAGARLAPALGEAGLDVARIELMAYGQAGAAPAAAPAAAGLVEEVDAEGVLAGRAEFISGEPFGGNPEVVAQILEATLPRRPGEVTVRFFAILDEGRIASYCRLFSDGVVGQVEEVSTLPAYRGRGYAAAVVSRAVAEALPRHELVFLLADADDWVRDWYERLGFGGVGVRHEVLRASVR